MIRRGFNNLINGAKNRSANSILFFDFSLLSRSYGIDYCSNDDLKRGERGARAGPGQPLPGAVLVAVGAREFNAGVGKCVC